MEFVGRVASDSSRSASSVLGTVEFDDARTRFERRIRAEAQETERVRIAQELHDTLLQGFFAVSMQLQTAVGHLPANCASKSRLTTLVQAMGRVIEQGRLAVQGLREYREPPLPLSQALAAVPGDLDLDGGVQFRVILIGRERELRPAVREDVYRIGREAIVNAYRHSGGRRIEVEIEYRAGSLRIAVRDDGCGIDPQVLLREGGGHWGLLGMRERAERSGGRLHIRTRNALGTEVELCVEGSGVFAHGDTGHDSLPGRGLFCA